MTNENDEELKELGINFYSRMIKMRLVKDFYPLLPDNGYGIIIYYPLPGSTFIYRSRLIDIHAPLINFFSDELPSMIRELKDEYISIKKNQIIFNASLNRNIEGISNESNDSIGEIK